MLVLETAHPGKFSEVVEQILESKIKLPEKLSRFLTKEKVSIHCSNKSSDFKDLLMHL